MGCSVCMGTNSQSCPVCGERWERVTCMKCRGLGIINCYAIDLRTDQDVDVTAETFLALPIDEQAARKAGQWYYQGDAEECDKCDGAGEIYRTAGGEFFKAI